MSQVVETILKASSAVTNNLANGSSSIMHLQEQQGSAAPYIILQSSLVDPNDTQDAQNLDEWEVNVAIVSSYLYDADSFIGAHTIAENVRTALHGQKGTIAGESVSDTVFRNQPPAQIINANTVPTVQVEQTYTLWINK